MNWLIIETNWWINENGCTFGSHADGEALFQTAFLTFPPHVHVNLATVAVLALVHGVLRYTPPEEA